MYILAILFIVPPLSNWAVLICFFGVMLFVFLFFFFFKFFQKGELYATALRSLFFLGSFRERLLERLL